MSLSFVICLFSSLLIKMLLLSMLRATTRGVFATSQNDLIQFVRVWVMWQNINKNSYLRLVGFSALSVSNSSLKPFHCCFLHPGNTSTHLCPVSRDSLTLDGPGSFASQVGSLDLAINGSTDPGSNNQLAELEPNNIQISANNKNHSGDRRLETNQGRISHFQPILKITWCNNSFIHCVWRQSGVDFFNVCLHIIWW